MDTQFWDEMYRGRDQLFSGNPNGVLVAEITGTPPGRALDIGCGEGGDARWLAGHGWQVTAMDIAPPALQRAAAAELDARVQWIRADLNITSPPADAFDLVSAQYFPLPIRPDHTALRGLLAAVAPGGTLLFVGHDVAGMPPVLDNGLAPSDYYQPGEVAELLDDTWTILINDTRRRTVPAPAGSHHTHDTVLRAQRIR